MSRHWTWSDMNAFPTTLVHKQVTVIERFNEHDDHDHLDQDTAKDKT